MESLALPNDNFNQAILHFTQEMSGTGDSHIKYDIFVFPAEIGQDFPEDAQTVYMILKNRGYHVMGCGKFDLYKNSFSWGRDGSHLMKEWGFSDGIDNEGKVDGVILYGKGQVGPYMDFLEKRGSAKDHV